MMRLVMNGIIEVRAWGNENRSHRQHDHHCRQLAYHCETNLFLIGSYLDAQRPKRLGKRLRHFASISMDTNILA